MLNTNTMAQVIVAADGLIDKMEALTGPLGANELATLAAYQTKLASARTNLSEDTWFLEQFSRCWNYWAGK